MLLFAFIGVPSWGKILVYEERSDLGTLLNRGEIHTLSQCKTGKFQLSYGGRTYIFIIKTPLCATVCMNTPHGNVPGRLDRDHKAYYTWGGLEYEWKGENIPYYGKPVLIDGRYPKVCKLRGRQTNNDPINGYDYYGALIQSEHGFILGKANKDLTEGWYGWKGKEYSIKPFEPIDQGPYKTEQKQYSTKIGIWVIC